jgi:hypothetical protein
MVGRLKFPEFMRNIVVAERNFLKIGIVEGLIWSIGPISQL